jgi:hypothetical protein
MKSFLYFWYFLLVKLKFFRHHFRVKTMRFFTIHVFWYMTPCRLANSLGGTCCLHLHCSWRRVDYTENGGTKIVRNAGINLSRLSTNTAALLQPRNSQSLLFLQNQEPSYTPLQISYEMFVFYSSPNIATVIKSDRRHGRNVYTYIYLFICHAMGNKEVSNNDAANVPMKANRRSLVQLLRKAYIAHYNEKYVYTKAE